jgi:predicted SAM-dependent methyltransferase
MAKDYYPAAAFYAADGEDLPFRNKQFFVAISSCILLHIPNYREHIRETVRVAKRYVVAHRTPICRKRTTQYLKKFAYGVETVELIFNEKEIVSEFVSNGLKLLTYYEYDSNPNQDHFEATYIFEKTISKEEIIEKNDIYKVPGITGKPMLLNLGCGHRCHKDWINIDIKSTGPWVRGHNLYLGIPFSDETFDAVYHSDLLEHFPNRFAPVFIKECNRVLKPGGIIRVAVPDLEQIVRLYIDLLEKSLQGDIEAQKRYEWIMIELFDQMVRNQSGGEMLEYWKQWPMPVEEFVIERCGSEVKGALKYIRNPQFNNSKHEDVYLSAARDHNQSQIRNLAMFRISGEVHQWMYDRYSLMKLLKGGGFVDIRHCRADESNIKDFNSYLLDIESDGSVRKPDSFYMEARK